MQHHNSVSLHGERRPLTFPRNVSIVTATLFLLFKLRLTFVPKRKKEKKKKEKQSKQQRLGGAEVGPGCAAPPGHSCPRRADTGRG